MEQNKQNTNRPDGISIGKLLMNIKEYFFLLFRYWYLILIFCSCFSYYNLLQTLSLIPTYPCNASFLIKTQTVLKENAVFVKIFAKLSVSEFTLRSSLFQKTIMAKKNDLLINHYIKTYQEFYPEQFGPLEIKPNFKFVNTDIDSFITEEKIAYNYIISLLLKQNTTFRDGFINSALDEKVGFLDIYFSSPSEDLSITFMKVHTAVGEKLFFESATFPAKKALATRKNQVDTLREEFRESYYELGRIRDKYLQYKNKVDNDLEKNEREITKQESRALHYYIKRITRLDIATQIFKADYMAGLKNLQSVEMKEIASHPLITITSFTSSPIEPIIPSWKKGLVFDVIISGLIISILIIILKILKDIMRELKAEQDQIEK
jgi:hypothetical protein